MPQQKKPAQVCDLEKTHLKYKICVSGSAETSFCDPATLDKAKETGRQIVAQNGVLVSGATTGVPYWAAIGAKEAGGISIGLSPAATELAHVKSYRLPTDYFDLIIYTGFEYAGRNLLMTRSSDAVIVICGRIGTLNEFTVAYEDKKPIGILEGCGGEADLIRTIVERGHRGSNKIVYDSDPARLVAKVIELIKKEKVTPLPDYDYTTTHPGGKKRG